MAEVLTKKMLIDTIVKAEKAMREGKVFPASEKVDPQCYSCLFLNACHDGEWINCSRFASKSRTLERLNHTLEVYFEEREEWKN